MPNVVCVGRDRVSRTFCFTVEKDQFQETWYFRVFTDPLPASGEFFELTVSAIDSATVRVIAIAHQGEPAYKAMGIPDAILPAVKATLEKVVVSSPGSGPAGEWRTAAATKVWERLRSRSLASYDSATDVYRLG